jgi:hypothetical protein
MTEPQDVLNSQTLQSSLTALACPAWQKSPNAWPCTWKEPRQNQALAEALLAVKDGEHLPLLQYRRASVPHLLDPKRDGHLICVVEQASDICRWRAGARTLSRSRGGCRLWIPPAGRICT